MGFYYIFEVNSVAANYRDLYNALIVSKMDAVIVEYGRHNHTFTYIPYSHKASSCALDDLYDLVIDNTVFYTFSEKEIISLHEEIGLLDDLRSAAKYSFAELLPKRMNPNSDGTIGEVLLDLLIQAYEPNSKKLIARAKFTEMGKKSEITGYDALYFTKQGESITLWLGQAKAGSEKYCKADIKKDLNTKFTEEYFASTAFYISTRSDSKELSGILSEMNKMCLQAQKEQWSKKEKTDALIEILVKHNVTVKIPCLLAYTKDIYSNPALLKEKVEECATQMFEAFDAENYSIGLTLPFNIVFYIFPIKDVSYIRNRIVTLKKEVV